MKISAAKQLYSAQLNTLWARKQELTKVLKEKQETGRNQDRAEISKELQLVTEHYDQVKAGMERIQLQEMVVQNAESAKQQSEAMAEASEEMVKCIEIARRIAAGDLVPPHDEKKLMEFDYKMYLAAKNMAMLHQKQDPKEYRSLWEEEETSGQEQPSASEIAENTEIDVVPPDALYSNS